ncbi:MAG: hypothetical protein FWG32_00240 [Oscillospiraceae bacterium]|nr:hypothetical protein [Oscillospiraceae bacterium]
MVITERPKLLHAYIAASASEENRDRLSMKLAAALLCESENKPCGSCKNCRKISSRIHPDVIIVEREKDDKGAFKKELSVERIRAAVADFSVLPNEAARKVYLIADAGYMNVPAQNALLKMLEEPPAHAAVILCAGNAGFFLDTIRSRCVEITENDDAAPFDDEIEKYARQYLEIAASGDRPELLRCFAEAEKMSSAAAAEFAECVMFSVADILCARRADPGLGRKKLKDIAQLMKDAEKYLGSNVGVKNLFGMICARTMELK